MNSKSVAGVGLIGSRVWPLATTTLTAAAIEHEPSGRTGQVGGSPPQQSRSELQQTGAAQVVAGLRLRSSSTQSARTSMVGGYHIDPTLMLARGRPTR